ncbi:DUF58 domain-containing protein [Methylicorpusculum oleiharenae]|uniref:DUF58 domain-containing protein n=1 Tax=Methylicorpusculum oleiharenae TaxID=1338687 RepID=UPI0013581C51|nr:DUF58 domain-containing protein [Methylicorpusculum oleiharenae]MCD2449610.1 DUF58 domain-containing protein [Methylicorpusculum oleiharenae]
MNTLSLKDRFRFSRFFRGEKSVDGPIELNQRRIFILPSAPGFGFVIIILLLLLISFVYNNNLVYLLTFLLASIFFVTILHSYQSLSGLVLQQGQSAPVFAGEDAAFDVLIYNQTATARTQVQLSLESTLSLDMAPFSNSQVRLQSRTSQRGWHYANTITCFSYYPLGLFRAWSPLRFNFKTLVYPKPWQYPLPLPQTLSGAAISGITKRGVDDFAGVQTYYPGASIKSIHWKAFAKQQGLLVKQYSGTQGSELWLDYEATSGSVEERLSQLCRWVLDAEQQGLIYGLTVPGIHLPPDHGKTHQLNCLEALALF